MKKNYVEKTLKNGIKVYFYSDKNCKRKFASYNVNFGSYGYYDKFYYQDKPCKIFPGMAHFIEHYLIEKSKIGNMLHRFKEKNFECNGLTYPEFTSYYFLGVNYFEESLEELIRMVDDPQFTKEDVEDVKAAVIEELKNASDSKYHVAFANNKNNLNISYEAVPVNNNSLGSVETTNKISLEDVKLSYDAYYNDENKFLVIGGDIDIDETLELLEKIYSKLEKHPNQMREFDYEKDFSVRKEREVIEMRGDADFIVVTYKEKNTFDIPIIKLDMCMYLYFKLKQTYLNDYIDKLIKEKVIIGGVSFSTDFFKDAITISFYTESYDTDRFEKELEKVFNLDGLEEKEFELLKRGLVVSELCKQDYIYKCFQNFPVNINFTKKIDEIDLINSITLDDVKEIISKLKFDLKTTTIITNKK